MNLPTELMVKFGLLPDPNPITPEFLLYDLLDCDASSLRRMDVAGEHIDDDEFRLLQAAVKHWVAWKMGRPIAAVWPLLDTKHVLRPPTDREVWDSFRRWLASRICDSDISEIPVPDTESTFGRRVCLALLDLMAADPPLRVCQNENCGRAFIHQVGTAKQSQYHTKGVKYCHRRCADATNQRAATRRRKEQKARS